ncbi:MAG: DUF4340 domain-containing protein [Desulfobacterales bacterium]|nr:DUF4340 domain-containing protein [Desulfobacterales bacterium]
MKLKKEMLILVAVMVAAVAYIGLRKTDRTHFDLPQLTPVTANKISKLEMIHAGQTVVLEKQDEKWRIMPQQWPADADKVRGMIDIVAELKITALVSEAKSYARYDLDKANRIAVKAWQGKKQVRSFDVGKSASTYQHTHVRLDGDPNVYHAREDFRSRFDRSAGQLRDRSVLSFKADEIQRAELTVAGKTTRLALHTAAPGKVEEKAGEKAAAAPEAQWRLADGHAVDPESIKGLISALGRLSCDMFIDDEKKTAFSDPLYTMVLGGKAEYRLQIFEKAEKDATGYPAVSSASPYPFTLSGYQVDSIKENLDKILNPSPPEKKAGLTKP